MELKELLEKATQSPWRIEPCPCGDLTCRKFVIVEPFNIDGRFSKEDALLLRHAVNNFELLLNALREIAKCEAPFKRDPLDFANSIIPKHVKLAEETIRQVEEV